MCTWILSRARVAPLVAVAGFLASVTFLALGFWAQILVCLEILVGHGPFSAWLLEADIQSGISISLGALIGATVLVAAVKINASEMTSQLFDSRARAAIVALCVFALVFYVGTYGVLLGYGPEMEQRIYGARVGLGILAIVSNLIAVCSVALPALLYRQAMQDKV